MGRMVQEIAPDLYESTVSIYKGWSGSPMLNEAGAAWGIVALCTPNPELRTGCEPGGSKAFALPALQQASLSAP